jgi:hypothetical protein
MKKIFLSLILLAYLGHAGWAVNADSLGGNPWTSYFRKDIPDTAFGMKWFQDSLVLGSYLGGAVNLPLVTHLYGQNNIGDPYWAELDMYGDGIQLNHGLTSSGEYGVHAIENNPNHILVQLETSVGLNTVGHLLRLSGLGLTSPREQISELMTIGEISAGGIGLGIYTSHDSALGIYVDHGGSGSAIRLENNFSSTGNGLYIDNNNTGLALRIEDVNAGRMVLTVQDSASKPAITALYRGSQSGFTDDSSMFYWWGTKGHKAEMETVKTALCGLRTFGNSGQNLCDTIPAVGVAESTTVVTANYAGGFDAATCTALRIKVEPGTIIVKRGAVTDPGQYYWQATKMLGPGQLVGPQYPLPYSRDLGFSIYPNPSTGLITARYALPRADRVQLSVYNMLGQKVRTVVDGIQTPGYYNVQWDGKNDQGRKAAAGVYLYQLKAVGCQETKKMVVVK